MTQLTGICAALCTPMDDKGQKLHETRLKKHIDSMIAAGVHRDVVDHDRRLHRARDLLVVTDHAGLVRALEIRRQHQ